MSTMEEAVEGAKEIKAELEDSIRLLLKGRDWNADSSKSDMCVVHSLTATNSSIEQQAREGALRLIASDFVQQHIQDVPPQLDFTLSQNTMTLVFKNEATYHAFRTYIGAAPSQMVASGTGSLEERIAADRIGRNGENIRG